MRKAVSSYFVVMVAVFFAALSFVTVSDASAGEKTYHWKISHIRPEGSPIDLDLHKFADKVRSLSDGRIDVQVYPANQLGDYTVVQERVSVGAVEMACQCLSTARNKRLLIQYMPYLARNWEEAKKIFAADSPLIKAVDDMMDKEDIKILSTWPVYFGGIATVKEANEPGKMHVSKGVKIRVPSIMSFTLLADDWGYMATPLAWADLFTSLQTGVVDGAIGAGAEGYYANFRDLVKYYYAVNDHFENWFLIINRDAWNSISPEDRKIISDCAVEMQTERFGVAEEQEKENMQKLRDCGIQVVTFTPEQLGSFAKEVRENIWPKLKEDIGEDLVNSSLSAVR